MEMKTSTRPPKSVFRSKPSTRTSRRIVPSPKPSPVDRDVIKAKRSHKFSSLVLTVIVLTVI
uniref:Uncharacterized protein n=1 Tax=Oryza punctata TaxID=4537 RepID=A0A1V1H0N5_ORYPU|nr:hypothetical protein [Oryza punctata]